MKCIFFSITILLIACATISSQIIPPAKIPDSQPKTSKVPPPGDIVLLDGYIHTRGKGIDTRIGEISQEGGILIRYDIGFLASNYAWRQYAMLGDRVAWHKEQKINGLTLYLTRGKDKSITATFPETCANFMASNVSDEYLVDFLLMIWNLPRKTDTGKATKYCNTGWTANLLIWICSCVPVISRLIYERRSI